MNMETLSILEQLSRDKGIDKNILIDALKAVVHLPDDTVAPVWLDERKGSAAGDVLVCRNGLPPGRATSGRPSRMLEPCGSANPPSDFP